jgi:hypothetical protein
MYFHVPQFRVVYPEYLAKISLKLSVSAEILHEVMTQKA